MTIPDKEQIYPEYYPDGIQRDVDFSKIDQIDEYLKKNDRNYAFCMKQPLMKAKEKEKNLLYYKSLDPTHWNMNGAFVGYEEIMARLKKDFPQLKVFSKQDFNIIEKQKSPGAPAAHLDSIDYLCKVYNFDDTIYSYELKDSNYNGQQVEDFPQSITFSKENYVYRHYTNSNNRQAPKLLVMGDSYIRDFLLPIMSESFSEIYYIGGYGGKIADTNILISLQQEFQADIVLYEFVEKVFRYDVYVPEIEKFQKIEEVKFPYENLQIIDEPTAFFIDIPSNENQILNFKNSMGICELVGWALDIKSNIPYGELYAKVGNHYYKAEKFKRPDVAKSNENFLMSGFSFHIPKQKLLQYDKIEFIVISNDRTYQYAPIKYKVSFE